MQTNGGDASVAAGITRTLAGRIVSGALAPGERLRQDHIAAEFHASHVPVREAFGRLQAQGLVVVEPRRGVRVASLDPSDVLEIAEMRAALETLALRHAMGRVTQADLNAMQAALDVPPASDLVALEAANRCFHAALATPCAMPRLRSAIADLHQVSARHLFAAWRDLDWRARSDQEHAAILASVQAGQVAVACRQLADHIIAAGRAVAEALPEPLAKLPPRRP